MGDQASVGPFVAGDSFLRHIDRKRHVMDDGAVSWEAFKPRDAEPSLSFTYQSEELRTEIQLTQYQRDKALPHGDLPGLCSLTYHDFTDALRPPLVPRRDPVEADEQYGHLHCVTDRPRDQIHMDKMAKLATRNGVLRPYVRRRRRKDL